VAAFQAAMLLVGACGLAFVVVMDIPQTAEKIYLAFIRNMSTFAPLMIASSVALKNPLGQCWAGFL